MAKNGKKLTMAEHLHLQKLQMQSDLWLMSKKRTNEWVLIHKLTGNEKTIQIEN